MVTRAQLKRDSNARKQHDEAPEEITVPTARRRVTAKTKPPVKKSINKATTSKPKPTLPKSPSPPPSPPRPPPTLSYDDQVMAALSTSVFEKELLGRTNEKQKVGVIFCVVCFPLVEAWPFWIARHFFVVVLSNTECCVYITKMILIELLPPKSLPHWRSDIQNPWPLRFKTS